MVHPSIPNHATSPGAAPANSIGGSAGGTTGAAAGAGAGAGAGGVGLGVGAGAAASASALALQAHLALQAVPSGYVAQERAYLRKIRNQLVDDYYTKGITGANDYDEYEATTPDELDPPEGGTLADAPRNSGRNGTNGADSGHGGSGANVHRSNLSHLTRSNDSDASSVSNNEFASNYTINLKSSYNSDILADIDENKYQIDFSLALSMMHNSTGTININPLKNSLQLLKDTDDPAVIERLEWQLMLTSVLTGDVVRSEKTKIIQTNPDNEQELFANVFYKDNLWFGIRAKLFNRTEDDQRKIVAYRRTLVDAVIEEVMLFEVNYDRQTWQPKQKLLLPRLQLQLPVVSPSDEGSFLVSPREQVVTILDKWEKCTEAWKTREEMKNDKPICRSVEFESRIDALNAWLSITDAIRREGETMRIWIGNDEMDITKGTTASRANSAAGESSSGTVTPPSGPPSTTTVDTATPASAAVADIDASADTTARDPPSALTLKTLISDTSHNADAKIFDEDSRSLAERLMKEKDVHSTFKKRIFAPLAPWMIKLKDNYIRLGPVFEALKLPDYIHDLIQLCLIPTRLIKEIISVRLKYAMRLQNPTLMMIDQMIDDFKSYITIALEVKLVTVEYCIPDADRNWIISDFFDSEQLDFDHVVLQCVRYFLVLLNRKLLDLSRSPTNFRTFKEPEELEATWNFLKCLGAYIDGGSVVVAEQITLLTLKLIHRLLAYLNNQIRHPPFTRSSHASAAELVRWYSSTAENFGQLRRKLARFAGEISRDFTNLLVFDMPAMHNNKLRNLLRVLKMENHFLVYTGTVESQGIYFFASRELWGNDQEILKFINGGYVGVGESELKLEIVDLLRAQDSAAAAASATSAHLRLRENGDQTAEATVTSNRVATANGSFENVSKNTPQVTNSSMTLSPTDHAYVLAICPPKAIVWEGQVYNMAIDEVPITDVTVGEMLLITKLPYYRLHEVHDKFTDLVLDVMAFNGTIKMEQRCSLARVHHELTRVNRVFYKMSLLVLDLVQIVRAKCLELAPKGDFQELINNYFVYARDYVKNSVKNLELSRKLTVIMKLMQLSIEWVSFICDDCTPTDRRTFRWCVLALEFAMDMTSGFNVFVLNEDQFYRLKLKVARCMSLLISHFDIMGARSSEAEKRKLLKWTSSRHNIENTADDELILEAYREDVMKEIEEIESYRRELEGEQLSVGRVLDITDLEYQFVTLLALSFLSVSIRWQKGRFIGGGLFGNVYAAVNLDTGGVMAVKEIRFHDSQLIKNIVPSIKDEMTVLEMLNHPNVVQYFGVEVHRDKVYIFMEYCEGGSLLGLLTHGRIEDEMVIQVYTLQMLEGLAYLHQLGVAHRDIKPENILLDHNGVIKFVDFGAAKVIANSGRTRRGGDNASASIGSTTSADAGDAPTNETTKATPFANINSMTGTPMYMSPEVITGSATTDKNGVMDIWLLGCCVLEMATGRRPWAQLDNEWAIMYHIAAGNMPQLPSADQLSQQGRHFLKRCLNHDPLKRPSAIELLSDPWIVAIRQVAFDSTENLSTPSSEAAPDYS